MENNTLVPCPHCNKEPYNLDHLVKYLGILAEEKASLERRLGARETEIDELLTQIVELEHLT